MSRAAKNGFAWHYRCWISRGRFWSRFLLKMKKNSALNRAHIRWKMSAPGAPVFGSVPHQDPECISGETNAVATDFLWNYQQSSHHATEEAHLLESRNSWCIRCQKRSYAGQVCLWSEWHCQACCWCCLDIYRPAGYWFRCGLLCMFCTLSLAIPGLVSLWTDYSCGALACAGSSSSNSTGYT